MLRTDAPRSLLRERIIREAFDVIADAQRVQTIDELNRTLNRSFVSLGFTTYVGLNVLNAGGRLNLRVMFGATHPGWEHHYAERGYARHDAVLRDMVRSTEPIVWSDLSRRRPLSPMEQRIYAEAAEFGLTNGLITPIPHLDGSMSAVLLTGKDIEAEDLRMRAVAHLLSLHYGAIARRIEQPPPQPDPRAVRLSERQIECLRWTRHGKSSSDIGDILGISSVTVDEYLAGACARLGVRTRVQATVEAILMGLID